MTEIKVILVPTESFPMWWSTLQPMLVKCPETWEQYESLESIYDALSKGVAHLMVVMEDSETLFAAIFTIKVFTMSRVMYFNWCAGKDIARYSKLFVAQVEETARNLQLDLVEYGGRFGWERILSPMGYQKTQVIMSKRVPMAPAYH